MGQKGWQHQEGDTDSWPQSCQPGDIQKKEVFKLEKANAM
jgi:hypothetical protein